MSKATISISSTGQYQTVGTQNNGYVYTSSDFGITWITRTQIFGLLYSISLNASGQYQTLVSYGNYIYTSNNYGVSWTQMTTVPSNFSKSVSISSLGDIQTAVVSTGGGFIYVSYDYGNTWIDTGASGSNGWDALAISGDGQFGLAIAHGTQEIWKSTNQGANWNFLTAIGTGGSGNWYCCAIAPSASVQLVGANGNVWPSNFIWKSSNYGTSFSAVSLTDLSWQAISIGG